MVVVRLEASRIPGRGWITVIYDDDNSVILENTYPEQRIGCAIRTALNKLQNIAPPSSDSFVMSLEDW